MGFGFSRAGLSPTLEVGVFVLCFDFDKITIIEADAIKFMENLEDGKYDYCFADIWESNIDIAPYLKLKPLEKKFKHMECGYWLEFNTIASKIPSLLLMFMGDGFEYKSKVNNPPLNARWRLKRGACKSPS